MAAEYRNTAVAFSIAALEIPNCFVAYCVAGDANNAPFSLMQSSTTQSSLHSAECRSKIQNATLPLANQRFIAGAKYRI